MLKLTRSCVAVLLVAVALSSCGGRPSTELQTDHSGTDRMLPSPCACERLDYTGTGTFTWRGQA